MATISETASNVKNELFLCSMTNKYQYITLENNQRLQILTKAEKFSLDSTIHTHCPFKQSYSDHVYPNLCLIISDEFIVYT